MCVAELAALSILVDRILCLGDFDCCFFIYIKPIPVLYCFRALGLVVHNFVFVCSIVGLLYHCANAYDFELRNLLCTRSHLESTCKYLYEFDMTCGNLHSNLNPRCFFMFA